MLNSVRSGDEKEPQKRVYTHSSRQLSHVAQTQNGLTLFVSARLRAEVRAPIEPPPHTARILLQRHTVHQEGQQHPACSSITAQS